MNCSSSASPPRSLADIPSTSSTTTKRRCFVSFPKTLLSVTVSRACARSFLERVSDAFVSKTAKPRSSATSRMAVVFPIPGGPLSKAAFAEAFVLSYLAGFFGAPPAGLSERCSESHFESQPCKAATWAELPKISASFFGACLSTQRSVSSQRAGGASLRGCCSKKVGTYFAPVLFKTGGGLGAARGVSSTRGATGSAGFAVGF